MRFLVVFLMLILYIGCSDKKDEKKSAKTSEYKSYTTNNHTIDALDSKEEKMDSKELKEYKVKEDKRDLQEFAQKYKIGNIDDIDKEFVALRKKYKKDAEAMSFLSEFSCKNTDCSALKNGDEYIYYDDSITGAIEQILMDKKTNILSLPDIISDYKYLLESTKTTSIDLQSQANRKTPNPYSTLQFKWDTNDFLEIIITPREEICLPNQHVFVTTLIKKKNKIIARHYGKKLPRFSFPQDLVTFVNESCSCARAINKIPSIDINTLNEIDKKAYLQPNKDYCNNLDTRREKLWDIYREDSRITRILQDEQKLY